MKGLTRQPISPVLLATFAFCASIVVLSIIPAIFPALYASFSKTNDFEKIGIHGVLVDYFESGTLTTPLVVANIVVFTTGILYWKNILPSQIRKAIEFIFSFEPSKKVTIVSALVILIIYISASAPELAIEENWADYAQVKSRILTGSASLAGFDTYVSYFLLKASLNAFGNIKIIPFIASIALLITVFFITKKITSKRFAGLVSLVLVAQSNIFLTYDTSPAYPNFWILFYLLSLYLVYRAWPVAHASFILSVPSKALSAAFFPMSLYFMFRAEMPRRKKILVIGSYVGMLAIAGLVISYITPISIITTATKFDAAQFLAGFTILSTGLRFDLLFVMFILPLTVGLFFVSRRGSRQAESILFILGWLLLLSPLVGGFTDQTNEPYRYVPLIVFFAIGVGVLLSKPKAI